MKFFTLMSAIAMTALTTAHPSWGQAGREKARFVVNLNTEHQIFNGMLLHGQTVCFQFRSLATGAPAAVRLRRTENGKQKDLDVNTGERCLTMHRAGGWYVVYATPVNEDVVVHADAPGPLRVDFYRNRYEPRFR